MYRGATGKVVKEIKVETHLEALVKFFNRHGFPPTRIGLEADLLSQWIHARLMQAGSETVLLETRHAKVALSAMTVKTDRRDSGGIALLLRFGWLLRLTTARCGWFREPAIRWLQALVTVSFRW
jgi:transposase